MHLARNCPSIWRAAYHYASGPAGAGVRATSRAVLEPVPLPRRGRAVAVLEGPDSKVASSLLLAARFGTQLPCLRENPQSLLAPPVRSLSYAKASPRSVGIVEGHARLSLPPANTLPPRVLVLGYTPGKPAAIHPP